MNRSRSCRPSCETGDLPRARQPVARVRPCSSTLDSPDFVIPSEARDLQFAAEYRSRASLGMTIHERCRSRTDLEPSFTTGSWSRWQVEMRKCKQEPATPPQSVGGRGNRDECSDRDPRAVPAHSAPQSSLLRPRAPGARYAETGRGSKHRRAAR